MEDKDLQAKYWEAQWLIGYYSDLPGNQWKHDLAVIDRQKNGA